MENKLLFNSGSWAVGTEGKKAVEQLASVLSQNKDINVLINNAGLSRGLEKIQDGILQNLIL